MISRDQIETTLRVNGASVSATDERIRSTLLRAHYTNDDVDTAILILREEVSVNKSREDGLRKIFRTDQALKPREISELLGIEVEVLEKVVPNSKARVLSAFQYVLLWLLSTILAVAGVVFYMYLHKVGVFHPSSTL